MEDGKRIFYDDFEKAFEDFGPKLRRVAWISFDDVMLINTTSSTEGKELILKHYEGIGTVCMTKKRGVI